MNEIQLIIGTTSQSIFVYLKITSVSPPKEEKDNIALS